MFWSDAVPDQARNAAGMTRDDWSPQSWREFPVAQQPQWPDAKAHAGVLDELRQQPPLVFAGEVRELKSQLAQVAEGKAFLLQAGDCSEEFHQSQGQIIREKLKILLQMAIVLTFGSLRPVVKVGRIAGQYAKPRSKAVEMVNGRELPSFRGEAVNAFEATYEARKPDPQRLLRAYHQSAATLNLLRAFTHGGFADLRRVQAWTADYVRTGPLGSKYQEVAEEITRALEFMRVCGLDSKEFPQLNQVDLYTSHEGLLLDYESCLTRVDSLTQEWYNCSAHLLWIGDRTRQPGGAHVEYFRGVKNPVGIKIGPSCDLEDLRSLLNTLNPHNEAGRIILICRFGAEKVQHHLPRVIEAVQREGARVVWCCDPMHGNTFMSPNGFKTRHFDHIILEIERFFLIHRDQGTVPGGIHLELTGDHVTECLGGSVDIKDEELPFRYGTTCDPRLNALQGLEIAFLVADMLNPKNQVK